MSPRTIMEIPDTQTVGTIDFERDLDGDAIVWVNRACVGSLLFPTKTEEQHILQLRGAFTRFCGKDKTTAFEVAEAAIKAFYEEVQ